MGAGGRLVSGAAGRGASEGGRDPEWLAAQQAAVAAVAAAGRLSGAELEAAQAQVAAAVERLAAAARVLRATPLENADQPALIFRPVRAPVPAVRAPAPAADESGP